MRHPSQEQIHKTMSAIRSKDTKPEMVVRRYLWSHGFRYRLNSPRLPGHPDIVLRKYRTCVFVNGCFWHGHEGCKNFTMPKTHVDFWTKKITRNKQRDHEEQQQLARMGWHCITVWECQLKGDRREETLRSLAFTLNHIYLQDRALPPKTSAVPYRPVEEESDYALAAEPMPGEG